MNANDVYRRYQELQRYVGWTAEDAHRVSSLTPLLEPHLHALVDDFYAEIDRHPDASKVITGGLEQITRLKGTLLGWLRELLTGRYDAEYVSRRWRVGGRHVEIGLNQVYTNAALARLRAGMLRVIQENWRGENDELRETIHALNSLLDLDLAIIEEAYQFAYAERQQRTERLAALGQVAGGIAHEMRNPLNVIKTSVYYLQNASNPTPQKKSEHLDRIERQVSLADGIITALSNFAKLPLPNLRPFILAECLYAALESEPLPAECVVEIDCPSEMPRALGDPDQLRIVFANLIRNAREAMPGGGRLSITGRSVSEQIQADVSDTGTGIEPERLARIMEPLHSTKVRGLGLGLAIARSILEKHNASLRVTSRLGHGSTFTVTLPAGP